MDDEGTFGRYRVHELVGSGGMATVHRATVQIEGGEHEVALKRLLPHLADVDMFVQDFLREGKLGARLRHPNIVQVRELGEHDGVYFIEMELVRGVSLGRMIKRSAERRPPIGAVLSIMLEVTAALDYAHTGVRENGEALPLVHRDLTPSNVLITDDGHVKIIDFGVAKALRGDFATNSGNAKGKLGYMSPEALRAQVVDGRTDVFSAGVVMWELLAGRRLFAPTHDWDISVLDKDIAPPSTHNPACPRELDAIVMRAVERELMARWPSAAMMHRALLRAGKPYASTANVREVAAWKAALGIGSSFELEPYANLEIHDNSEPSISISIPISFDSDESSKDIKIEQKASVRAQVWSGDATTAPAAPGYPRSAFPPEPTATGESFLAESPSVSVRELPADLRPDAFDPGMDSTEEAPAIGRTDTRTHSRKPLSDRASPRRSSTKPAASPASARSHATNPASPPPPAKRLPPAILKPAETAAPAPAPPTKPPTAPGARSSPTMPPPIPARSGSSTVPPPIPARSGSSTAPPPIPARSGSATAPPPIPARSGSSTVPPPIPAPRSGSVTAIPARQSVSAPPPMPASATPASPPMPTSAPPAPPPTPAAARRPSPAPAGAPASPATPAARQSPTAPAIPTPRQSPTAPAIPSPRQSPTAPAIPSRQSPTAPAIPSRQSPTAPAIPSRQSPTAPAIPSRQSPTAPAIPSGRSSSPAAPPTKPLPPPARRATMRAPAPGNTIDRFGAAEPASGASRKRVKTEVSPTVGGRKPKTGVSPTVAPASGRKKVRTEASPTTKKKT